MLLGVAAACGPAPARPSPAAPTVAPATAAPRPTAVPGSEPPTATLTRTGTEPVAGSPGSSCWDGACSDAPWLPGSDAGAVVVGDPLAVDLEPALEPTAWTASWAPLAGGTPGEPIVIATGARGPIEVRPSEPGEWSLQVFARFGDGRDATWYWRLDVAP